MSAAERKLVTAIRDTADKYLAAANYAEQYIYGHNFARAMIAYNDHALAIVRKQHASAA